MNHNASSQRQPAADPFAHFIEVPRIHCPTPAEWTDYRRRRGGPAIITGAFDTDRAASAWTVERMKERAGHRMIDVEYSAHRIYRPDPRLHRGHYFRKPTTFAAALDLVREHEPPRPYYYLPNINVEKKLPELLDDVVAPRFIGARRFKAVLFAGGDGTGTHLHYDTVNNYLTVFSGVKRVVLFPPGLPSVRALPFIFSMCQFSELDLTRARELARTKQLPDGYRCEVGPGEILHLPIHWWHFVENRGLTVGVTLALAAPPEGWVSWRQLRVPLRGVLAKMIQRAPVVDEPLGRYLEWYAFTRRTR